ncbi:hypothetical protein LTR35_014418 [Friedmanniomyces endolithicus]|uniref:Uncharacterized protein n=1 Tax=Friedmanniomyces endolithicus TaxID=329885 RepID=A0AAN6J2U4_9PEZI|nr:hypothetical protein LTR35_014418 [Friedmanniomyces endolithicus]KAK0279340.1 hypothetical protein LTS00_013445 [Friedmanniomyces endolithicus]KAK0312406.1 hypothetical protein LTR82_013876 [Friedmanniomyces endolithicus]KAK0988704.1 hypothetical protein LTR54_012664 [Friedmanniomyces endolithicus]
MVAALAAMWVRGQTSMHDTLCAEADVRNGVSDFLVRKCFAYALKLVLESAATVANWGHLLVLLWAIKEKRAPPQGMREWEEPIGTSATMTVSLPLMVARAVLGVGW